jgi:hypothetical protein
MTVTIQSANLDARDSEHRRIIGNIILNGIKAAAEAETNRLRIVETPHHWFPLRFQPDAEGEIIIPDLPREQAVGHVFATLRAIGAVVVDNSLGVA